MSQWEGLDNRIVVSYEYMSNMACVLWKQELLTPPEQLQSCFVVARVAHLFSSLFGLVCFAYLRPVSCMPNVAIVSAFMITLQFSEMFILKNRLIFSFNFIFKY
jgi:hypothetical protein